MTLSTMISTDSSATKIIIKFDDDELVLGVFFCDLSKAFDCVDHRGQVTVL